MLFVLTVLTIGATDMRRITYCAEIGSNHKGVKSLAYEHIRQAKMAGATIAKFQLGHRERGARFQYMRYAPMEWAEDLATWCDEIGIRFMASIFSQDALRLAESVGMKEYKIAHQVALDAEQAPLVASIIATNKPVYISGTTHSAANAYPIYTHIGTYPTYEPHMPQQFGDYYGYSSHAHGAGDALLAIARGAMFIEKHVTLNKTEASIRDNHFALDFNEYGDMVKYGNEISTALGNRQP